MIEIQSDLTKVQHQGWKFSVNWKRLSQKVLHIEEDAV